MSNRISELALFKENAASGATDSGARGNLKAPNLQENDRSKQAQDSSPTYTHGQRAHSASARAMGYALTLGDFEGWIAAGQVWALRLKEEEVATLAWSSLRLLSPEVAQEVVDHLPTTSGCPIAPLLIVEDEAESWTMFASNDELRAYLLACFNRLSAKEQREFIGYVQGRSIMSCGSRRSHQSWGCV